MTKQAFISELRSKLSDLPRQEVEGHLSFYGEMIDDRIEEGLSEEDAVRDLGTADDIAAQIIAEIPLTKIVKNKMKRSRSLRMWEIVLLALGSPIWLSLLIAAFAVFLSLYVSLWSIIVSLWAVFVSVTACFPAGIFVGILFSSLGNTLAGLVMICCAAVCAGVAIFLFFGCKLATKGICLLTKKIALQTRFRIKKSFLKKEAEV